MGALRVSLCSTDDHLFVPTCVPWRKAASGGQGWPKVTAERREASLRAAGRLATLTTVGSLGEASASRDPYRAREAEPGSPSKTVIANPADIVALLKTAISRDGLGGRLQHLLPERAVESGVKILACEQHRQAIVIGIHPGTDV